MEGQLFTTSAADVAVLTQAIGNDSVNFTGRWFNANMHLFKNNTTINKATLLADLTEADFPGYAASDSITFNTPILEDDGSYSSFSETVQFAVGASSIAVNETIYGAYLTGSGADSATLLAVGLFPTPIVLDAVGEGLQVNLVINQGGTVPNMEVNIMQ